jgi:hypothetical protein
MAFPGSRGPWNLNHSALCDVPVNGTIRHSVVPLCETGALNIKKDEATLTPVITYLLRCNTGVTILMSGTAIKAIVAYISDYITKPGLRTSV